MEQAKKPVIFSFGNMKGGVGKSTLTTVLANYIHHASKFSVCICDCDDKQLTIQHWREEDLKKGFKEDDQYDIHPIKSKQFPDQVPQLNNLGYHFVGIDLPGNILQEGVMPSYAMVDLLFVPFNYNETDFDSTLKFLDEYKKVDELRQSLGYPPAEKFMVFSKIDKRMGHVKELDGIRESSVVPILRNFFPYSPAVFGRDATTSQIYKKGDRDTEMLCEELVERLVDVHNKLNS